MAKIAVIGILVEKFRKGLLDGRIVPIEFLTCSPYEFFSWSSQVFKYMEPLFGVPIAETHVDAGAFERLGEDGGVLAAIVIRIDHGGMKGTHRLGRGQRGHGVWQVHGDEGHVDEI